MTPENIQMHKSTSVHMTALIPPIIINKMLTANVTMITVVKDKFASTAITIDVE